MKGAGRASEGAGGSQSELRDPMSELGGPRSQLGGHERAGRASEVPERAFMGSLSKR